ncbi:MAG: IS1096 element passenger TnpR family protein [Halanaerobiales bacterium]
MGGEGGYQRFLEIINDRNHEQYEEMRKWGRRQGYSEFDIKIINSKLK